MIRLPTYDSLPRPDLLRHAYKVPQQRSLDDIEYIVPHHTGDFVSDFTKHASYHVDIKRWAALGYHLYDDGTGPVVSRELTEVGAHVRLFNQPSVGVCIPGNFNKRRPTDEEYWQWIRMIIIVELHLGRRLKIKLHSQMTATTCPGRHFDVFYFFHHLNDMRELHNL